MGSGFVHLHNHMEGSHSDSALRMTSALDQVRTLGMNAFALTDHGEMAMVPAFARAASERGIRPIVGFEAYFVEDAAENIRRRINHRYHLTLIARDQTGYANLIRLATASWRENCLMQKLGLVDWRLLEAHHEGLLCLSGCLAGPVGWSVLKENPTEADRFCGRFTELLGDRYYIEVFDHGMPEEKKAVEGLLALAGRYGRRVVLANDCHYLEPADWELHDTLIKTRFGRPTEFELPYHEYFIKSPEQMRALAFPTEFSDATLEIAERVSLTASQILGHGAGASGEVERAFLGVTKPIEMPLAVEKAAGVMRLPARLQQELKTLPLNALEEQYPEVARIAKGIAGLPQKPEPDLQRVVAAPGLLGRIPLRRSEKVLFTMWDEAECRRVGAQVLPIEQCAELQALSQATSAYLKGKSESRRRKFGKAASLFREALEHDPDFTNALYELGLCHFYQRNYAAARETFEEVLRREPDFERLPNLRSHLGWCLHNLGEEARAVDLFRGSLEGKAIPGSLLGLGEALERLGRTEEARAALMELLQKFPSDSRVGAAQGILERIGPPPPAPGMAEGGAA